MRRKVSKDAYKIIRENFWGIVLASISAISLIFIMLFGIGPFILLLLFGVIGFVIGNSFDRGVNLVQSFKDFLKLANSKLKEIIGKREGDA